MLSGVRGRQVRGAGRRLQGSDGPVSGASGLRRCMAPAALALLLGGCASFPSSMNPVSWWHDLEGGEIAKERPPPPGATEPYPNLASVPPKPEAPDRATLENITNALVADRTNAQHLAEAAPLADPSSPSASPALFGKGTLPPPPPAPPPGAQTASANLSAAEAPPPAPTPPAPTPPAPTSPTPAAKSSGTTEEIAPPPAKAPVGEVQTAPLAPPGAAVQPTAQSAAPLAPPGAAAQPTAQSAAPPPLPTTPPPPPSLPGATVAAPTPPAASPAAVAPPRAAPPLAPPAPAPQPARTVPPPPAAAPSAAPTTVASASPPPPKVAAPASAISLTFIAGSADLPALAADQLKQLAGRRGNGIIAVTGYGDAASNDPDAQAAALTLGLSRAKAMAAALTADGVPASAVQMDAEAIGRGGTARLVQ